LKRHMKDGSDENFAQLEEGLFRVNPSTQRPWSGVPRNGRTLHEGKWTREPKERAGQRPY